MVEQKKVDEKKDLAPAPMQPQGDLSKSTTPEHIKVISEAPGPEGAQKKFAESKAGEKKYQFITATSINFGATKAGATVEIPYSEYLKNPQTYIPTPETRKQLRKDLEAKRKEFASSGGKKDGEAEKAAKRLQEAQDRLAAAQAEVDDAQMEVNRIADESAVEGELLFLAENQVNSLEALEGQERMNLRKRRTPVRHGNAEAMSRRALDRARMRGF